MRIACWSGPRNISTALMRSFEARRDCAVVDEPLYAAWLEVSGADHPGRELVLASQPRDPLVALRNLREADGEGLVYEKHMAHHWVPGWPREAIGEVRHLFLIRDPARVVASYAKVREAPTPLDLGYLQQLDWIRWLDDRGESVVVVDGDQIAAEPALALAGLCAALGIPFAPSMLSWPPGRRPTDGVWAPFWYAAVEASTGFVAPRPEAPVVPDHLLGVVDALRPAYEALSRRALLQDSLRCP